MAPERKRPSPVWNAFSVRSLRERMELSQQALAQELGVRQQTVSEWETGLYAPRGASRRMLSMVAEKAGLYEASAPPERSTVRDGGRGVER